MCLLVDGIEKSSIGIVCINCYQDDKCKCMLEQQLTYVCNEMGQFPITWSNLYSMKRGNSVNDHCQYSEKGYSMNGHTRYSMIIITPFTDY